MSGTDWQWDKKSRRYRDGATGRYLSAATVLALRDDFLADRKATIADATARLVAGELPVADWLLALREAVTDLTLGEYVFGRGGRNAMADADFEAVASALRGQLGYLQAFAEAVRTGDLTARQVAARGALYASASRQAFERGKAAAWGNPPLPVYPGEGSECHANCRCRWSIAETATGWEATWILDTGAHDNCATCRARARDYAPLILTKEAA